MWPVGQLRRTYNRNGNIVIIPQFFRITEEQKKPMAERPKTYSIWSCECLFITDLTSWWWFSVRSTRGCQASSSPRAAWGWPHPVWPPPRPPAPPEHNVWLSWSAVSVAIPTCATRSPCSARRWSSMSLRVTCPAVHASSPAQWHVAVMWRHVASCWSRSWGRVWLNLDRCQAVSS